MYKAKEERQQMFNKNTRTGGSKVGGGAAGSVFANKIKAAQAAK